MTYDAAVRAYLVAMEMDIAKRVVDGLLAAGYEVSVNDSEEVVLDGSRDAEAILAAMRSSDEDYLLARPAGHPEARARVVRFVYGNDGWDVVNDYHVSLEPVMAPINEYCDRLADGIELASLAPVSPRTLER